MISWLDFFFFCDCMFSDEHLHGVRCSGLVKPNLFKIKWIIISYLVQSMISSFEVLQVNLSRIYNSYLQTSPWINRIMFASANIRSLFTFWTCTLCSACCGKAKKIHIENVPFSRRCKMYAGVSCDTRNTNLEYNVSLFALSLPNDRIRRGYKNIRLLNVVPLPPPNLFLPSRFLIDFGDRKRSLRTKSIKCDGWKNNLYLKWWHFSMATVHLCVRCMTMWLLWIIIVICSYFRIHRCLQNVSLRIVLQVSTFSNAKSFQSEFLPSSWSSEDNLKSKRMRLSNNSQSAVIFGSSWDFDKALLRCSVVQQTQNFCSHLLKDDLERGVIFHLSVQLANI